MNFIQLSMWLAHKFSPMTVRVSGAASGLLVGGVGGFASTQLWQFALFQGSIAAVAGYIGGEWLVIRGRHAIEACAYDANDWALVRSDYLWALYFISDGSTLYIRRRDLTKYWTKKLPRLTNPFVRNEVEQFWIDIGCLVKQSSDTSIDDGFSDVLRLTGAGIQVCDQAEGPEGIGPALREVSGGTMRWTGNYIGGDNYGQSVVGDGAHLVQKTETRTNAVSEIRQMQAILATLDLREEVAEALETQLETAMRELKQEQPNHRRLAGILEMVAKTAATANAIKDLHDPLLRLGAWLGQEGHGLLNTVQQWV